MVSIIQHFFYRMLFVLFLFYGCISSAKRFTKPCLCFCHLLRKAEMADTVAEIDLASSDRCLESTPTNAEISASIGDNNVFLIVVI